MDIRRINGLLEAAKRELGEDHPRCEIGTRWNEKNNRCEPFHPEVHKAVTSVVRAHDSYAKLPHPEAANKLHRAHLRASKVLDKHGFSGLARDHRWNAHQITQFGWDHNQDMLVKTYKHHHGIK